MPGFNNDQAKAASEHPSACIPLLRLLSLKVDERSRLNDVCYVTGNIFYDPEALVLEFMLVCSPYVLNTEASILTASCAPRRR